MFKLARATVIYQCQECGYESAKHLGRCPECNQWNAFSEKSIEKKSHGSLSVWSSIDERLAPQTALTPVSELLSALSENESQERILTGFEELDRVLGGGIMPGSYVLMGGDPGIGKSTLMLQLAENLSNQQRHVLYVSGEESAPQLKHRAERLGIKGQNIHVLAQTSMAQIEKELLALLPEIAIIDSIQSIYSPEFSGTPGSIAQVRECASMLMQFAKRLNCAIFLIGHVTKEGMVAGPKLLEHTVDCVLYLEGDSNEGLRLLRSVKNRFGGTQEIGLFEMAHVGLRELTNPSQWFLPENSSHPQSGSVITATMHGNRPLLLEIQSLVTPSAYSAPTRVTNGLDKNRLHQLIAILERRTGVDFSRFDVYVNVVTGLKIQETAADLPVALSLLSSLQDKPLQHGLVVCGELGLTGEVRSVTKTEQRLIETQRLGFKSIIYPNAYKPEQLPEGLLQLNPVSSLVEALPYALGVVPTSSIH